jgi:magnesium chelatase family protein
MADHPPWGSDAARVHGAAIIGAGGYLVDVDAAISNGPSLLGIHGLPATSTRETRDRIRAAIINSTLPWPGRSITINLLPPRLPKRGTSLDLAIALAVLTATGTVPQTAPSGCMFAAELGLDGRLRPVPGVLPMVLTAAAAGCARAVVAPQNAAEAAAVPGVAVTSCQSLQDVHAWLRGDPFPARALPS